jgi:hypothetical protein
MEIPGPLFLGWSFLSLFLFSLIFLFLVGEALLILLQEFSLRKPTVASSTSSARLLSLEQLKSKVGLALAEAAALRINLNLDGTPIASKSHTSTTNPVCARRVNLLV